MNVNQYLLINQLLLWSWRSPSHVFIPAFIPQPCHSQILTHNKTPATCSSPNVAIYCGRSLLEAVIIDYLTTAIFFFFFFMPLTIFVQTSFAPAHWKASPNEKASFAPTVTNRCLAYAESGVWQSKCWFGRSSLGQEAHKDDVEFRLSITRTSLQRLSITPTALHRPGTAVASFPSASETLEIKAKANWSKQCYRLYRWHNG